MSKDERLEAFPKTDLFEVVDTMGVPHPYCITPAHVAHAADNFSGFLGKSAIEDLEKKKGRGCCGVSTCELKFEQHEQAVVVKCSTDDREALRKYLLDIKEKTEKSGFVGFVLMKAW